MYGWGKFDDISIKLGFDVFCFEPEVHEFRYRQNPKMVLLAYRIYISKLLEDQSGN
jgi:hypothetical protein